MKKFLFNILKITIYSVVAWFFIGYLYDDPYSDHRFGTSVIIGFLLGLFNELIIQLQELNNNLKKTRVKESIGGREGEILAITAPNDPEITGVIATVLFDDGRIESDHIISFDGINGNR